MKRIRRNYLFWVRLLRPALMILLLLAAPLIAWFLPRIFREPFVDSIPFSRHAGGDGWFPVVHFSSNAVFNWRIDPFLAWALDAGGVSLFFALCIGIFGAGACLFAFELHDRRQPLLAAVSVAVSSTALVLMFGFDTFVAGSFAWFPWVLFFLYLILAGGRRSPHYFILLLFFVFRLCRASNQLSILLGITAFIAACFLADRRDRVPLWICFLLVVVPSVYTTVSIPAVDLPLYPSFARVVENRVPFLEGGDVLIGPQPPFQTVPVQILDRSFLRSFLEPFCFTLLLISVVSALDVWRRKRFGLENRGVLCAAALCTSIFCVLDTSFVSPVVSQISPIYTLPRIIPGLIYFPIIYLGIALNMFFISILLVSGKAWDILVLLAVCLLIPLRWDGWDGEPYAQRPDATLPWREILNQNLSPDERGFRVRALMSPSYGLILANTPGFFSNFPRSLPDMNLVPLSSLDHRISASRDGESIRKISEKGSRGRWSSGGGSQLGGEWFHIYFPEPRQIRGIKVDLDGYPTDFPRGLEVRYAEKCSPNGADSFEHYAEIFRRPRWRGEIAYTDEGYPYMEPEANVFAAFSESISAQCLLVRQTGRSDMFEWSVTGIQIGQ